MTRHKEEDVFVEIIDLGNAITEQVTRNADGTYTIFLNARYSYERLQEAFQHAYSHIEKSDFEKEDVQEVERNAHGREKE